MDIRQNGSPPKVGEVGIVERQVAVLCELFRGFNAAPSNAHRDYWLRLTSRQVLAISRALQ